MSLKETIQKLPRHPGVYLFKNKAGVVIYVGKATNLWSRVGSYFKKNTLVIKRPIEEAIHEIADIQVVKTGTVIEALILEAKLIKEYWPPYNVLGKDNKSFLYMVITKDEYPRVLLLRGEEVEQQGEKNFTRVYGPFTSSHAIRESLKILRRIFPYSTCRPDAGKECFNAHIGLCPGVCTGKITVIAYKKIIRHLVQFFEGKRLEIIKDLKKEMLVAARDMRFEDAARLRGNITHLEHIQDVAVLTRDVEEKGEHPLLARIEGYDISNISGMHAVGSMVVFIDGEKAAPHYRKFAIKTVEGANDVAMLAEVMNRRLNHPEWGMPSLLLIDGGLPQVNRVKEVLAQRGFQILVMGIAKGPDRKKVEFITGIVTPVQKHTLLQFARLFEHILVAVRDESHRFAKAFYTQKHRKTMRGDK